MVDVDSTRDIDTDVVVADMVDVEIETIVRVTAFKD
jgi:hypothetical protein